MFWTSSSASWITIVSVSRWLIEMALMDALDGVDMAVNSARLDCLRRRCLPVRAVVVMPGKGAQGTWA